MSDEAFDGRMLAEKLSKLNSSQQSIESLSRWCITHRKKAKQTVETWDKLFKSAQKEQCVSFLYLANDILQNSRRKGSEFVNEFWKVLPAALRHVYENGEEYGKKTASRLVDIWEERKVFGSRGQNLKDEMLGKNPPLLVSNGKNSNPIKVMKRDAHSLRIKLAVGGMPEKIVTAFQSVHDDNVNEETALSNCTVAVERFGEMEKDVENVSSHGLHGFALVDEIQEQENLLQQCVSQLEIAAAVRAGLASQLKEALEEQESKLDFIRSQLHAARGQLDQAVNMKLRLASHSVPVPPTATAPMEAMRAAELSLPSVQLINTTLPPPPQSVISFASLKSNEEENKKATVAAVAAKLAASTSSAQMLTSVLSSLVAEEAASMSSGLKSGGYPTSLFPPEKKPKLETPISASDVNTSEMGNSSYFTSPQHQTINSMPLASPTSMRPVSQTNQMQSQFPPPPPPPPPIPPANPTQNQFVQSAGLMMGVIPYGYGSSTLPPPPPLPSHIAMGLVRPAPPPPQQQQPQQLQSPQQQSPQPQQQPANGSYYRPPGIGFYGQSHQSATPPVPRQ